jgi:hypothetical protein
MDETLTLNAQFRSFVSLTFNSMTHLELETEPRGFHLHETHIFSSINMLPCHKKCLSDNLLNADETEILA